MAVEWSIIIYQWRNIHCAALPPIQRYSYMIDGESIYKWHIEQFLLLRCDKKKKKDSLKSNSMKREWVQWNWFFLFLQDFIAHTLSRFAFSSNKALFLRFVCRCTILNHSKRFVIIILNEMPYSCAWILISFFRLSVDAIFAVDCQEIP